MNPRQWWNNYRRDAAELMAPAGLHGSWDLLANALVDALRDDVEWCGVIDHLDQVVVATCACARGDPCEHLRRALIPAPAVRSFRAGLPRSDSPYVIVERLTSDGPWSDDDLNGVDDVVTLFGADVERWRLRQEFREAVRASQRLASQLHQLIAVSLAVSDRSEEGDVAHDLARAARSIFNAEDAVVEVQALGEDTPLIAHAARGRLPRVEHPRLSAHQSWPRGRTQAESSWIEGSWLCAPVRGSNGDYLGHCAVRRESPFRDEDRELLTLLAQMTGVSIESLGLHRSVASSEERLRALIDAAPVSIIETDGAGSPRWWNATASRLLSWSSPEVSRTPQWPDDVRRELSTMWEDLLSGRAVPAREFSTTLASRDRIISAAVTVLPSASNEASLLSLLDDITDQQELREEVRHAHRMELRGQVASSVAHDFNNLITLISGYAEMLGREVTGQDRASSLVRDIVTTSQRAASLTTQLQSLGRTTTNSKTSLDVSSALASNAEVLERILGSTVTVVWELDTVPTPVLVDANLFEQMVLNLAINARDAMTEGGTLTISSARMTLGDNEARERSVAPGPVVRLRMSDTGHGMDEATLQRCFEPLFTTKGPYRGTGMGLASARRFVDESGGSIRAESTLGRGTTFDIILPALDEPAPLTPVTRAAHASLHASVLVVEDDPVLRRMVVQVLSRHGLTLSESASGEEALALVAHSTDVDLLITDVDLGAVSGLDVAREFARHRPHAPVIVMSGRPLAHVTAEFPEGIAQFLPKPFRPTQLVDATVEALTKNYVEGSKR